LIEDIDMMPLGAQYLPPDRLRAVAAGERLPLIAEGAVLLADISGFTPVTERLRATLGARRGAEELAAHLNSVYDALIAQVERYGGSIVGFAGDAITCWFGGEISAARATACGFALLEAMRSVQQIALPEGGYLLLGLKVAITSGTTKRYAVGDPAIQLFDILAGDPVARLAVGEELAERDELLIDALTVDQLDDTVTIREWRGSDAQRFAVLDSFEAPLNLIAPAAAEIIVSDEILHCWMLPALTSNIRAGLGEFQIELRPVTALFLRFSGIDYDGDADAEDKLDRFVQMIQSVVSDYEGNVLQLTVGDKGSYLYAVFGAPFAHEDDSSRALNAALDIRERAASLAYLQPVQIGISLGTMRTGAYGSITRRTYGVLGDEVNLAARLMAQAEPGEILISEMLSAAVLEGFVHEPPIPMMVKGKANPIRVYRLLSRRERSFAERFYTTPLVGRDDALTALKNAIQPIFEGRHAGVSLVYGEPGMGKSRMAFELQKQLQQGGAGITWLTGQADVLNRSPLGVFAYFLRPYFAQQRDKNPAANRAAFDAIFEDVFALADEALKADLSLYRSFLAGILDLVIPDSPYETADEKLRIDHSIIALKAWARAESRRQPLLLHLEDVQWLDPSSMRAVQQLTYNMEDIPLALLLTSRYNDDGTPFTIPNIYSVPVHNIDLTQLSDEGVHTVATAVLQGDISEQLARFIQQRAGGNPFFTEQLVLDLKERGVLSEAAGVWDIRPDAVGEVPSGVNAVLIARLDRLAAQVKTVVQTAAVLGREFEIGVLSRMLREADTPAILEAEREAIWSAISELRYLFRHALLRDAAYEMQARERLKALHRLAAETIETLYLNDSALYEVLLEHWQNAGDTDKILFYTVPICERLGAITADYARAETLLQRALALGETPIRAMLLRMLGDVARLRGQYPEAVANYEACLQVAGEDVVQRILALNGLGSVRVTLGDNSEAVALFEQGLDLARQHQDPLRTANVLSSLGWLAYRQGENDLAQAHFTEGLQIHRQLENHRGTINALLNLSSVASVKANHTAAYAYLEEGLALAREIGARQQIGAILGNLGTTALQQGDYQAARPYYESSLQIRREIGERDGIGAVLGNLAILALRQGNLLEAKTYGEASLNERRAIGDKRGIANALSIIATTAYDLNDNLTAQRYFEEILEMQRAINDRWGMATTLGNLGELTAFTGNFTEAWAHLSEGLALYRQLDQPLGTADTLMSQGNVAYEQGDTITAREMYQEALKIRREIDDRKGIPIALLFLAHLDMESGNLADAESQLYAAMVQLRELNLGELPRALVILAIIKRRLGQSVESVNLLKEALSLEQVKSSSRRMLQVLEEVTQLLFLDERYLMLSEWIGMFLEHNISYRSRQNMHQLLDDLRPHLDASTLEVALERGKMLNLDEAVARLLAEL
jgi:class 3 adenylate cyclase/predicted ATPase